MATSGDTPAHRARASGDRKKRVKQYDTTGSRTIEELDPNSSYAKAYALIPAGSRVLDLGCGSGELASFLAARGDRVWGVDINPAALAQAAPSCVETRVADLERADVAGLFPGQLFDVVVFADVLEHLREPWNMLQSARRVLDIGGCIVASIPNFGHAAVRLAVVSGAMPYRGLGILDGTHVRFFTRNGVTSLFEESGFRVQAIDRTTLPFDQPSDLVPDVRLLRVPGEIERHVREDPENETLQFVVRAITLPGEWDMDALRDRLHDVEAHAEEQAVGMRNLLRENAAALALVREREAEVSALEDALEHAQESAAAEVRAQAAATAAEREQLAAARAQEAAARRELEGELADAQRELREANATAERALREATEANEAALREATEANAAALRQAAEQRDDARAAAEDARAELRSREHALAQELERSRREVSELRDVLAAARERTPALVERCAVLQTALADADRRTAMLQDAYERGSRREAHAAEVIAAAEADRAALEAALARADATLATVVEQRDDHAGARAALTRYAADAEATQTALRAALQAATGELELLRRRARHDALAWMAREHAGRGDHEAGAQFWSDGLARG